MLITPNTARIPVDKPRTTVNVVFLIPFHITKKKAFNAGNDVLNHAITAFIGFIITALIAFQPILAATLIEVHKKVKKAFILLNPDLTIATITPTIPRTIPFNAPHSPFHIALIIVPNNPNTFLIIVNSNLIGANIIPSNPFTICPNPDQTALQFPVNTPPNTLTIPSITFKEP